MSATENSDQKGKPFWETVFGRIVTGVVVGVVVAQVVKK